MFVIQEWRLGGILGTAKKKRKQPKKAAGNAKKTAARNRAKAPSKKTRTEAVRRRPGKNLPQVMSSVIFHSDYHAAEEIISNSFDEDAEHVRIEYKPEEDYILFEDDGEGADVEGLDAFFRLGDSLKQQRKLTKKGRMPIGKFGIATLALKYLGNSAEITAWKEGKRREIKEDLSEDLTMNKPIKVQVNQEKEKNKHGMRIKVSELNALREGRDFTVDSLIGSLRRNMPMRDDFKITINGKEIKPVKIERGAEYCLDEMVDGVGRVHGSFFVCSSPIPDKSSRGVHIKVNGRRVGDPFYFRVGHQFRAGLETRLTATVYADGLDPCIGFDRTNLKTDHPRFKKVEPVIKKVLGSLAEDFKRESRAKQREKLVASLEQSIENVTERAMKQFKGIRSIAFDAGEKAGTIARFNPDEKRVYVNPEAIKIFSQNHIDSALANAVIHAITNQQVLDTFSNSPTAKKVIAKRDEQKAKNLEKVSGDYKTLTAILEETSARPETTLNPYRLYSSKDLNEKTGVSYIAIRRLRESGVLEEAVVDGERRKDHYFAKDFKAAVKTVQGYVPLHTVLSDMSASGDLESNTQTENTITGQLEHLRSTKEIPSYLLRVGKNQNTCYFVQENSVDEFKEFLKTEDLKIKPGPKPGAKKTVK